MEPSVGTDVAPAVAIVEGPADLLAALGDVGVLDGLTTRRTVNDKNWVKTILRN